MLLGAIQILRNADGGGGVKFSGKKRYEGIRFNVISVTRGWVGVQFQGKKRYVTLEWPLRQKTGRSQSANEAEQIVDSHHLMMRTQCRKHSRHIEKQLQQ